MCEQASSVVTSGVDLFSLFNDTATTENSTLSLHDALPIYSAARERTIDPGSLNRRASAEITAGSFAPSQRKARSEEHTSELQSHSELVCRLLLEKKKRTNSPAAPPRRNAPQGRRHVQTPPS